MIQSGIAIYSCIHLCSSHFGVAFDKLRQPLPELVEGNANRLHTSEGCYTQIEITQFIYF